MSASPRPAKRLKPEPEEEAYSDHEGVEFLYALRAAQADEHAALAAFFRKGNGEGWARSGGWPGGCVGSLHGVRVDADGHVVSLDLRENNVAGRFLELVPELRRLPRLERLVLTGNALTGPMPASLLSMPSLASLHVGANQLTGALSPEFLDKLDSFEWEGNDFTAFWRGNSSLDCDHVTDSVCLRIERAPASSSSSGGEEPAALTQEEDLRLWTVFNIQSAVPAASCTAMIEAAETYAAAASKAAGGALKSGWTTSRHGVYYSTTDIPVGRSKALLALVNRSVQDTIFPAMADAFGFLTRELWMQDCFVARYDMAGQRSLRPHLDGSDLSFVCALNLDFEGGGTLFHMPEGHENVLVRQRGLGDTWMFSGRHWHSGVSIEAGTRYILAGLVKIHTHDPARLSAVRRIRQGFKQ